MFQDKVDKIKHEIEELENSFAIKKNKLNEINNESERYEVYWDLKELYEKTKEKYRSLEIWSDKKQTKQFDHNLKQEIYYFELCLDMLKKKHGPKKIDLRHFLNVAELEYLYFIERNNSLSNEFLDSKFQLDGDFSPPPINLIFNNIKNAQMNLKLLIDHYFQKKSDKDLFLYNEVMGDLYIHLFCYHRKYFGEDQALNEETPRKYLFCAFYYYQVSIWHKNELGRQDPYTGFDGLHGWQSQIIFHDFLKEIGVNWSTDVHEKNIKLTQKYPLNEEEEKEIENRLLRYKEGEI